MSGASPGATVGPTTLDSGQAKPFVAVVRPAGPEEDLQKSIIEYLWLGMIPYDETKTHRLTRRAKGYLIHDNELYSCNT
jgi:hypothetical protein